MQAVTPDPQVLINGFSKSICLLLTNSFKSSGDNMVKSSFENKSPKNKFKEFGICPE